jgi:hypothetical protein
LDSRSGQIRIEEGELPLISQHLDCRLAEHGEIQRGSLDSRIREHYLVRQRCLPRARSARNQIE